ncbi:TetR family transcriptional regulator [Streptomyces sp. TRM43335]|uniref:TetR family transcriptional regulator n=1 Tax=Streptomyces taklimakanensis TaxID=2569853 RepID=A0A6G2BB28_9ACTN|nr:TetR/AcrR family transcriptional regulator [Streptomyces taklimakanensis]MTE19468.1 TetR family transcriptional regulator [Streptomyces taklimakanensis]
MADAAGGGRSTGVSAAPHLRADAARNRERIVEAAREALALHGTEASLDEIARRAGVGNATLYRHFPDRSALAHDVVLAVAERIADRAQDALDEEGGGCDPFDALSRFVAAAVEERIGALCPVLSGGVDEREPRLLAARLRLERLVGELFDRARRAGRLRADADVGDLLVALGQLTRPLPGTECAQLDRFLGRHLRIFLDGLRAPARSELPGRAATVEAFRQG